MSEMSLEALARSLPAMASHAFRGFVAALLSEAERRMDSYLDAREPVGATSKLKNSRVRTRSADGGYEIGYTAPYAQAVNVGRVRSKPYSRRKVGAKAADLARDRKGKFAKRDTGGKTVEFTRMLGSKQPQARRGMTRGAFRQLRREWGQVIEEASREAGVGA